MSLEAYPNCFRALATNPEICRWWWPLGEDPITPCCGKWDHKQCPTEGRKPRADSERDGYPD